MTVLCESCPVDTDVFSQENLIHEFPLFSKEAFQSAMELHASMSCEYHFVNLFAWYGAYHLSWCKYKGRILIYNHSHKVAFMPLGEPLPLDELLTLSRELYNSGLSPNICLACRDYIEFYRDVAEYYTIEPQRDFAEYLYLTQKMAALPGQKLHKKRNLIAQFTKHWPQYETARVCAHDKEMICSFSRKLLQGVSPLPISLQNEYRAIVRAMENFDVLGMEGLYIKVDGKLVAFSLFSPLNSFTYDIHFEKADYSYKGSAQIINRETARFLEDKCLYINREQDLGVKGLRQAKLSYEPEALFIPNLLRYKEKFLH